jgi:hypothetical protein
LFGHFPVSERANRFIEADLAVMPHLTGVEHETRTAAPIDSVDLAETAGMTDFSMAYGIARDRFEYLVGGRAINLAAKYVDGREADHNVGAGFFATVRVRF